MKKVILLTALMLTALAARAEYTLKYSPDQATTTTQVQFRPEVGLNKHFGNHASLRLTEEVRLNTTGFKRADTHLSFRYRFNRYVRLGAGYTFRLAQGTKRLKTFHRLNVSAAASIKAHRWKFTLQEKPIFLIRGDSINSVEKNRVDIGLRHKLTIEYNIRHRPLKTYASIEVGNTLNAKSISGTDGTNTYTWKGNYIDKIRPTIGLKWTVGRMHELNFYYVYDYDYERDYNITKNKHKLEVTRETTNTHAIGIAYVFDLK